MTTTSTCQGYDQSKPTSRVLQPPGGGSSNIFGFGGGDEPAPAAGRKQQPQPAYQRSNILGQSEDGGPAQKPAEPQQDQNTSNRLFGQEDSPQSATPVKPAQYNPITGEAIGGEEEETAITHSRSVPQAGQGARFNPITGRDAEAGEDGAPQTEALRGKRTGRSHFASTQKFNPITGEAYAEQPAVAKEKEVPSTRVRQPPGGASSGLW